MGEEDKPEALLSVSCMGWAFENIARQLEKHLSDRYRFTVKTQAQIKQGEEYALAVNFYWWEAPVLRQKVKAAREIVCLYDLFSTRTPETAGKFVRITSRADGVVVGSEEIARRVFDIGVRRPVFICEDGVDLDLFPVQPVPSGFVLGWCGNAKARGDDFKGLSLIEEAARQTGVPLKILDYADRIPHEEMAEKFYREISAYCCASVSEGTPNPVLEALACGRPCITTRVGLTPKLIKHGMNGLFVDRSAEEIASAIRIVSKWGDRSVLCRKSIERQSWKRQAERWAEAMEFVQRPCCTKGEPMVSESAKDVTVFLITVGDKRSRAECESALKHQTVPFQLEVIENVAPMAAAFQQMLVRCKTPFFVQVDEDMVLRPDAIERLYEEIKSRPRKFAMLCGALHDEDADRNLYGVKCYRTDAARIVPFENKTAVDVNHTARLQKIGYVVETLPIDQCFGEHAPFHTPASLYKRWKRLMMKQRQHGQMDWVESYPESLLQRWRMSSDPKHLYAALGAIAGIVESQTAGVGDDYTAGMPDFDRLTKHWPIPSGEEADE